MRKNILLFILMSLLLGCLLWSTDCAWRRWGIDDKERIRMIVGEAVPQARVLKTIYDDGCWAVFFELSEKEAEALWERVAEKHKVCRLDPMFTFGIGEVELNQLTGSHVLIPSAGDGSCRYLVRLADGRTIVAIRAHYGI